MNDFQNDQHEEALEVHYSRRHRKQTLAQTQTLTLENVETVEEALVEAKLPWPRYISYFLLSLLVSASTVVLPYLSEFASGLQLQHLYTGTAVAYGQLPYVNHFATGGFLYYVIVAILSQFQKGLLLAGVQFLALFLSGIYFDKTLIRLTNRDDLGQGLTFVFYLLQLAFGFGGLYPIQWATPFLLMGLYYLTSYLVGKSKDEIFIGYGFVAGLSLLLDPKTFIFWILALVTLVAYNLSHKRFARGFYQFLALAFGLVIPIYVALYFMLNLQLLVPALKQTVLYPLMISAFESEHLWLSMGIQFVGLLLGGLLTGWLSFYGILKSGRGSKWSFWLIFLVVLVYSGLALTSRTLSLYPLLYILPFGLLLTGAWLVDSHVSRRPKLAGLFFGKQFLLPLLLILVAIAYPVGRGFLETPFDKERDQVATYLTKKTSEKDKIYVWDKSSRIYLKAKRPSASQISSPSFYSNDKVNASLLEDELLQHGAKYFVLNKDLPLPETVVKDLAKNYKEVTDKTFSHFVIYKLK